MDHVSPKLPKNYFDGTINEHGLTRKTRITMYIGRVEGSHDVVLT